MMKSSRATPWSVPGVHAVKPFALCWGLSGEYVIEKNKAEEVGGMYMGSNLTLGSEESPY